MLQRGLWLIVMGWVSLPALAQRHYSQSPGYQKSFGVPISEATPSRLATPRELDREYNRLLVCVRSLVEEARGGENSVVSAIGYLDAARAARWQSIDALEGIVRNCEKTLPTLEVHRYPWRSVQWQWVEALEQRGASSAAVSIVKQLLRPDYECTPVRLGVNIAFVRIVNGQADCRGTNGRRELWKFSGWSPIAGFSLGADLSKGNTKRTAFYSIRDEQKVTERYHGAGALIKQEAELSTVRYDIPEDEEMYSRLENNSTNAPTLVIGFGRSDTTVKAERIAKNWMQARPDNRAFVQTLLK